MSAVQALALRLIHGSTAGCRQVRDELGVDVDQHLDGLHRLPRRGALRQKQDAAVIRMKMQFILTVKA